MAIKIGTKTGTSTTSLRDLGVGKIKIGFDTAASSSSGSSSSGGSSKTASASTASDADVLGAYVADMYARLAPEEIEYEAKTEEEIRASIAEWLRPSYDQAIANRQEQTLGYMAELDADAIARGMGASTYVTDVKNRQQNDEASDIATLEIGLRRDAGPIRFRGRGVGERPPARNSGVQRGAAAGRVRSCVCGGAAAVSVLQKRRLLFGRLGSGGKSAATVTATSAENCETFLSCSPASSARSVRGHHRVRRAVPRGAARFGRLRGLSAAPEQYPSTP
jgi:hypothetical protein